MKVLALVVAMLISGCAFKGPSCGWPGDPPCPKYYETAKYKWENRPSGSKAK
jgi:hypothetical protein